MQPPSSSFYERSFNQHSKNNRLILLTSTLGLLLFLVASFTFPFNHGLFSSLFNKPASNAAENGIIVDASTVIRTIPPTFFGINYVGFWDNIQGSPTSQTALAQTGIKSIRFPGGVPGDWYDWKNPYCQNWSSTSPLDLWNYAKGLGSTARVLFQTNYQGNSASCDSSGTAVNAPQYQADWVSYNRSQGINANMEVGNEEDQCMQSWHDSCFQPYISAFDTQAKAMHGANPAVKIYGPAATNEWYWWYDPTDKNSPDALSFFLEQEGNKTGDGEVDGVSLHYYTNTSCSGAANCYTSSEGASQSWLANGGDWQAIQQAITANDTRNLPVDVSEWNVGDSDNGTGFNQTLGHALVVADMIGAFAQSGVDEEDYFDTHAGNQYGILYGSGDTSPADSPNPTYYAMVLWGKMGNLLLNLTQSYDPVSTVSSYATTKADKSVQVMAINKSSSSQPFTINYQNTNLSSGTVDIYTLTPMTDYTDISVNFDGVNMPSPQQMLPGPQTQMVSSNTFTYTLPAYSIVVFDAIPGSGSSSPTPTTSPTPVPTPTLTPSPSPTTTPAVTPTATPSSTPTASPSSSPSSCPSKKGDFDSDGVVNLTDLSIFAASFGTSSPNIPNPCTDLKGDGKVDLTDLSLFAAVYGT